MAPPKSPWNTREYVARISAATSTIPRAHAPGEAPEPAPPWAPASPLHVSKLGFTPGATVGGNMAALKELRPGHVAALVKEEEGRREHEAGLTIIRGAQLAHEAWLAFLLDDLNPIPA